MESSESVLADIREKLRSLPPLSDDLFTSGDEKGPWKIGFILARRILKVLFDNGLNRDGFNPVDFHELIHQWLYGVSDPSEFDGIILDFDRNWSLVELPEGEDPATYNWKLTAPGTERLEVDESRYTKPNQVEDARLILTFFANLQDWLEPDGKVPFCSRRKLAELMGKSKKYVDELMRRLTEEGALVKVPEKNASIQRAPRYQIVPQERRVPINSGARRSRRPKRSGRSGRQRGFEDVTEPQPDALKAPPRIQEDATRPVTELKEIVPRILPEGTMTLSEQAQIDFVERAMQLGDGAHYRSWWEDVWDMVAPYDDCVRAVYEALAIAENSLHRLRALATGSNSINSPERFVASVAKRTLKKHGSKLPKQPSPSFPRPIASGRAPDP